MNRQSREPVDRTEIGDKRGTQGGMQMLMGVVWDVLEYPGHMELGPERKFLT